MTKQELIKAISIEAGITQVAATAAVNAFQNNVTTTLAKGEDVLLVGFGTFKTSKRKARAGRNPATGEVIQIPAKTAVSFIAGKGLKAAVN